MKITRIETIHIAEFANILFVRIHTDSGLLGLGETYYTPNSTRAFIHDVAFTMLLGQDPRDIERHWRRLYDSSFIYGNRGNEMRAISALEVALWDLLGQHAGLPIYRLLGGAARDKIRIYNTCAGALYGRGIPDRTKQVGTHQLTEGRYEDLDAFTHRADRLAQDLMNEGITAMKIWPFDPFATETSGHYISFADLEKGLEPVRKIRDAVGMSMEIMIEGHGYWTLPAAVRIAEALAPYQPMWLEDMMKPDSVAALAQLRRSTPIPICASELILTRYGVKDLLAGGRRYRDDRCNLDRRDQREQEDRGHGGNLQPAVCSPRLHRAGNPVCLGPPVDQPAQCLDSRMCSSLLPRVLSGLGDDVPAYRRRFPLSARAAGSRDNSATSSIRAIRYNRSEQ